MISRRLFLQGLAGFVARGVLAADQEGESLEAILAGLARVAKTHDPPLPICTVYLIGQEHYQQWYGGSGRVEGRQEERLPLIQTQVYHILDRLVESKRASLIIGEGLPKGQFPSNDILRKIPPSVVASLRGNLKGFSYGARFFGENMQEPSYVMYKLLHSGIILWGIDDAALLREIKDIDQKLYDTLKRYLPTKQDAGRPELWAAYHEAEKPLLARRARINDERSDTLVEQSLAAAQKLYASGRLERRDYAIVIGASHLPRMHQAYHGKACRVYTILPAAVKSER